MSCIVAMSQDELFDKFADEIAFGDISAMDVPYNYCAECNTPMEISGCEYYCTICCITKTAESGAGFKDLEDIVSAPLRVTTGANRGRFYNATADYTKTQRKVILEQLLALQKHHTGPNIPTNILMSVATRYNNIQKLITEDEFDIDGNVSGQKKFVRRSTIKDEILGTLIHFECLRESVIRKKKDIAIFMGLSTHGFARGEDILRNLHAEGKIDLPSDEESVIGYVEKYMETLDLNDDNYNAFVIDLVKESERKNIGMSSQISSKIVGAIWILVNKKGLRITAQMLEKATDNTKKNTFVKFYNVVFVNMRIFGPIFVKYGIPK